MLYVVLTMPTLNKAYLYLYSRILDTSAPGQIGTCVGHFGTKTNRHPGNSAPQKDKSALF
jgi:hypothetical protein